MAAPVFVSHSSKDREIVVRLCHGLERRGIKCWVSSRDVAPGENYQEAIVRAIGKARIMILVFTQNANNSDEIKKEISLASQHKLTVIPVRVEDVVPSAAFAYELATRQWINMFDDWDASIRRLEQQVLAISAHQGEAPPQAHAEPQKSYGFANPPPREDRRATGLTTTRVALGLVVVLCLGFGAFGITALLRARAPIGETQRGEMAKSEPAKSEPAKSEWVKNEPTNSGNTKTEIAKAEPPRAEPPKIEPAKGDSGQLAAPAAPAQASDKGSVAPAQKAAEAPAIAAKAADAAPAATPTPVGSVPAPATPPAPGAQAPAAADSAEPPLLRVPAQPALIPAAIEPAPKAAEPKSAEPKLGDTKPADFDSTAPKAAAAPAPSLPAAAPAPAAPAPTPAPAPAPTSAPAPIVAGLQAPVVPPPPPTPPPIAMAPPAIAAVGDGGQVFQECESCAEMVVIPAGTALIGSAPGEPERRPDEGPRQEVRFAAPFAVGRYEVSFAEWDA